jgi:hypothetical protein
LDLRIKTGTFFLELLGGEAGGAVVPSLRVVPRRAALYEEHVLINRNPMRRQVVLQSFW